MTTRHRLNRGGHRQANAALYRVVIVRMRHHEPTKAYVARRTAEGKTKSEIIGCLERLLAREIWAAVRPYATPASTCRGPLDGYRSINALVESTVGSFKTELIHRRGPWRDVEHVEIETLNWVDWFTTERPHESLADLTPGAAE